MLNSPVADVLCRASNTLEFDGAAPLKQHDVTPPVRKAERKTPF
jgi:hypothetical protein